ncbi:MAG: ABC transporter permease [Anaerolineae bacterium]
MSRRSLLFIVLMLILVAPALAPYDAWRTSSADALQPPNAAHIMGTDALGRDVFSRLLAGGQRTLLQALAAVALATLVGVLAGIVGALGAYWMAAPVRAFSTALLAVPPIVWSLSVLALLGSGPVSLVVAVALPLAALMAAMSRATFRQINSRPYVTGARVIGAGELRVVINTIIPNSLGTLGRYCAVLFTYAILNAAGLAYLGFSQPGEPEWGTMLSEARLTILASPWPAIASGLAITALVWGAIWVSRERTQVNR